LRNLIVAKSKRTKGRDLLKKIEIKIFDQLLKTEKGSGRGNNAKIYILAKFREMVN